MMAINATIRNGRIEPDEPSNLPEAGSVQIAMNDRRRQRNQ